MNTIIQKKICLLGDFAVGKTSLVRRFVEGRFDDKYLSTIGVKVSRKTLARPYGEMNLLVWDLAGSSEFDAPHEVNYLRGAAGAVITCDLTRLGTLGAFEKYSRLMRAVNPNAILLFVANKQDLSVEREISDEKIRAACLPWNGGRFFLSSAKTGEQVELIFKSVVEQIEAQE
jgi:small GTP-binding protein